MGKILSLLTWDRVWGVVDDQINEVLLYVSEFLRKLLSFLPKKLHPSSIYDWIDLQVWNFRAMMSWGSDDDADDEYFCIDKEGFHPVGDVWSSKNRCNRKMCIAHDTIKEMRCPIIPTENHNCKVIKGDLRLEYPRCCDELRCPANVLQRPLVRPAKPLYWIHESYIHAFGSSSDEEELLPHPSTISAKASGLTPEE